MFSASRAIAWKFARLNLLPMAIAWSVIALAPVVLYLLLQVSGIGSNWEVEPLQFHFNYVGIACFGFGLSVFAARATDAVTSDGRPSHFQFILPVSTVGIVTIEMLTGTAMAVAAHLLIMVFWRQFFDLRWPILAPTLLVAAATCLEYAASWWLSRAMYQSKEQSLHATLWLHLAGIAVILAAAVLLVCWIHNSYYPNGLHSTPRPWQLTLTDKAIFAGLFAGSWLLAVHCAHRHRCGETVLSVRLRRAETMSHPTADTAVVRVHQSAGHAADWYFTRTVAAGVGISAVAFSLLPVWLIWHHHATHRPADGIPLLAIVMPALTGLMSGALLGVAVADVKKRTLHNCIALLPVTDAELGRRFLWNAFRVSIGAWSLAFGIFGLALLAVVLVDHSLPSVLQASWLFEQTGWMAVPLVVMSSMACMWSAAGTLSALFGAGSLRLIGLAYGLGFGTVVVFGITQGFFVPEEFRPAFREWSAVAAGACIVITTAVLFLRARQRGLISDRQAWLSLLCWGVEAVLCCTLAPLAIVPRLAWSGMLALTVTPVATAPLALSMNRHR